MSNTNKLQSKFNLMLEEQRKLQEQFKTTAQAIFKETVKDFFDQNPGINALVWTQYTPYFNDGDECVFGVSEVTFTNASDEEDLDDIHYDEYNGENESIWAGSNLPYVFEKSQFKWNKELIEKINAGPPINLESCNLIESMISSVEMQEIMKSMFGDHVRVVATREGFDVRDHEHD